MKNIVICSDGTGNSALKGRGTNVFKIYEAVDLNGHRRDEALRQQIAVYDDGVGTEKLKPLRALGGAFGWGLSRNVRQLYTELSRVYEPGDRLFLFGFSRGAFTVRTLAGMIVECGIPARGWESDQQLASRVSKIYRAYRRRYRAALGRMLTGVGLQAPAEKAIERVQERFPFHVDVPIRFVGVWDTVDAVGFPIAGLALFWNAFIHQFKFPTATLHPRVHKACHALAIDDERQSFHPTLWQPTAGDEERIEQVWFAGVHSNIGGGYPKQGMSLVTLDWMMARASRQGLRFVDGVASRYSDQANVDDQLYDSRSGLAVYYRYKPREIGKICGEQGIDRPQIHVSAVRRIVQATGGYAPGNLPQRFEITVTDPDAPGNDEERELLRRVAIEIGDKLVGAADAFRSARRWISARKGLHWALWISTIAVVGSAIRLAPTVTAPAEGFGSWLENLVAAVIPGGLGDWVAESVVRPFAAYPALGLTLLLVLALSYYLGLFSRVRLERIQSRFWRRALPEGWRPDTPPSP